jgi:hypothetical protein
VIQNADAGFAVRQAFVQKIAALASRHRAVLSRDDLGQMIRWQTVEAVREVPERLQSVNLSFRVPT